MCIHYRITYKNRTAQVLLQQLKLPVHLTNTLLLIIRIMTLLEIKTIGLKRSDNDW